MRIDGKQGKNIYDVVLEAQDEDENINLNFDFSLNLTLISIKLLRQYQLNQ